MEITTTQVRITVPEASDALPTSRKAWESMQHALSVVVGPV